MIAFIGVRQTFITYIVVTASSSSSSSVGTRHSKTRIVYAGVKVKKPRPIITKDFCTLLERDENYRIERRCQGGLEGGLNRGEGPTLQTSVVDDSRVYAPSATVVFGLF
ncbi:hypothetical protein QTP88_005765 [Uroleucon formosanum]